MVIGGCLAFGVEPGPGLDEVQVEGGGVLVKEMWVRCPGLRCATSESIVRFVLS